MFGNIKLKVDVSGFQQALRDYKAATNKNIAPVLNGATSDILWQVANECPKAQRPEIKTLPESLGKVWWAIVTKRMMQQGATLVYRKTKKRAARRETIKAKGLIDFRQHYFTRKQREKMSKQMIASRLRSIGFARSAIYKALAAFKNVAGGNKRDDLTKAEGKGIKATPATNKTSFFCRWDIAKGNAQRLKATLEGLFEKAIADKTGKLRERIEKHLKDAAAKLGGKVK